MSLGHVLLFTVYVLAAARVTRLINVDKIADPIRLAVARRIASAVLLADEAATAGQANIEEQHRRRADRWAVAEYFIGCPWCVSIWLCASTTWLPMFFADNRVVQYVGLFLAASMIIGLLAPVSAGDEDIEIVAG